MLLGANYIQNDVTEGEYDCDQRSCREEAVPRVIEHREQYYAVHPVD
jgi:hypothetical protein